MPLAITNSLDISSLDFKITANTKDGKFYLDVTPSIFIGSGAAYVKGASFKVVNPLGVVIQDYTTSGYDIEPPMTSKASVNIPKVAGVYLWGTYTIKVRLTDQQNKVYELEKSINLCQVDKKNKNKNTVCINANIIGDCVDGKVVITLDGVPNYKGQMAAAQVNDLTLYYPTESGLAPLDTVFDGFSVQLYEGEYKFTGDVVALYDYGDNVFFEIKYDVKCSKIIRCIIDECCIYAQLEELNSKLTSDCSNEELAETQGKIFDTLRLLKTINLAASCGEDPSDYIIQLESILGCSCSCNCNDGTPIINNTPLPTFSFQGCGFTENTVGQTKVITINNYDNKIQIVDADNTGIITDGGTVIQNCIKTNKINIVKAAILSLFTANNGIRKNSASNFRLGGALVENTTIDSNPYNLTILNNVNVGINSPATTSKPRLKIGRNINSAIDEGIGSASWSELYTANLGSLGTIGDYAGAFGIIGVESTAAESTNLNYSFAGVKGAVVVNNDNAVDAFLSSFTGGGSFQSYTVGNYLTHGKLTKFAVYRAVGPKQIALTSTQEFGGITDSYGLYIESMSGNMPARITRVWGVYQEDALDKNWMASTLKVGGSNTIADSAQLEVASTTKGFLLPRMTKAQRNLITSPVAGLMIYQTDNTAGLRTYNGTNWMRYTETAD
jgi:hypothetical protein